MVVKMILALVTIVGGLLMIVALPVVVLAGAVGAVGSLAPAPGGGGVGGVGAAGPAPTGGLDIPAAALVAYQLGAAACPGLSWTVLAGIGKVESDHGRSTLPGVSSGANSAGAEGPLQFLPATFAEYAVSTDGLAPSPYDIDDAAVAAGRLLCADGATAPGGLQSAIWSYNHSSAYVAEVLAWASRYAATVAAAGPGARPRSAGAP